MTPDPSAAPVAAAAPSQSSAILSPELPPAPAPLRAAITAAWTREESEHVRELLATARQPRADWDAADRAAIQATAADLVRRVRARAADQGAIEAFMRQYDLGSEEGVLLMCVAEALLRIPDPDTADALIRDKLGEADWKKHVGQSDSVLVNASTWGLMLTGHLVDLADATKRDVHGAFKRLLGRLGEPVIRLAVRQAMRIMGHQFVMGRTIEEALARGRKGDNARYRYSFDMLGEAALTAADADRYLAAYRRAIAAIGGSGRFEDVFAAPSISVKLSALHPRYEHAKRARVLAELTPRVLALAQLAKSHGIGFTIDAEEADRLELSLDVIAAAYADPSLQGWEGYGLAVQAYQKRAPFVIDFLADLARRHGRRIPVRLVKGAYWDSEVKRAQVDGQAGYPVFTRKPNTDVSYLANAARMLDAGDALYPMFATHNAQTIAAVHRIAAGRPFEFQKLHGMGDDLYAEVIPADRLDVPCRVYAPVGSHEDLLPYLVRRLLENGANSSFVNRITDEAVAIDELVRDPVETVAAFESIPHPRIPLPRALYRSHGLDRDNSMGINLANDDQLRTLAERVNAATRDDWRAAPLVPGVNAAGADIAVSYPADRRVTVGQWRAADAATVEQALRNAVAAQPAWDATPAAARAAILEHAADLLEQRLPQFIALCTREAGKTIPDGVAEVREAVDFLRYYAGQARTLFGAPQVLPGPTGEANTLQLGGRGVFVCISPWNFPLAIFSGQIAAALAAGNAVLAKPAEQTNLVGYYAVKLLHEAGVPEAVLQFLPGDGATVGAALTADPRVAGVAFTGSTDTARAINRALAARDAAIGVLIAETGGQNALIGDSSALPEQLVKDALASAFTSAGQRCSAARVLFVQEDIADKVVSMLAGAMAELQVGDPGLLSTDVGPVIDADALGLLQAHAGRMQGTARLIAQAPLDPAATAHGSFFAPTAWELTALSQLTRENFGPALHVIRWKADQLDAVVDAINATGYGLTLGIHSRIDATIERIAARARVGNIYVNRNQIGAVVGVQPFGGQGLSGTGPKAGGPHYLPRFATEKTLTVNTTAAGGNASLLTLGD
ncbi:bifunctional proline dehydrogenase/L-glutamate gamma-semialdehyde dehydrogenase PutA [Cognatiluteimonas weifangensis]|uniref:Bifunctional protein PutA n=1 Tax=Cognatiluteimonas weifangensis TaxID=2303539 RepID=A0A372DI03_9GAMM|nr:bifunctional proline dehydrogenase/L-glutamate gamma-semialdehyde dehydrogenase PutA [Luteimonas weifangensis]RFP59104.1 bifunctional proline dehydrogenase/L-glutamate gamma-semialdehyde dehydrogenase PutA [Luteimonas weifangensis]